MLWTIGILVIIGYLVLYLWSRTYLEGFGNRLSDGTPQQHAKALLQPILAHGEKEVLVEDVQDGLEASMIFQNEGSREASQQQISDAMTRYPLDWSTQGPNSQHFQEKQAVSGVDQRSMPQSTTQFPSADAPFASSAPQYASLPEQTELPVMRPQEVREQSDEEILRTYVPKSSKGLLEYAVEDVKHMIERIYDKRGEVAEIVKSKQGDHVWEIIEVREKNPTIVWEGESSAQTMRRENMIDVPHAASDLNPFLAPRESVRKGKNDLSPQLQRMYEPMFPVKQWA